MQGWKFVLLFIAAMILMLLLLCQDTDNPPPPAPAPVGNGLLPGEKSVPEFRQPIIEWASDTECAKDTTCPSRKTDCVVKPFVAQKDTTYHLYAVYYNGDTLNASCRVCASLYEITAANDTVQITDLYTACPTGGPWAAHPNLKAGKTYLLSVCLHKCGDMTTCTCGEVRDAFGVVSIRDLYGELRDHFRKP